MIDWPVLNKAYPLAVAFAIDDVGRPWLFGAVPVYMANRWCVNADVWKMPLSLINPAPSNPAGSLIVRDDQPGANKQWEPQGPTPVKQGEKPKQVEPIHAKGWATSDPAPAGMQLITDAHIAGAEVSHQSSPAAGVELNTPVKPPTVSVIHRMTLAPEPASLVILTHVVRELINDLPAGARRDQLLTLLNTPS